MDALTADEDAYRIARLRYEGGLSNYQSVLLAENPRVSTKAQSPSTVGPLPDLGVVLTVPEATSKSPAGTAIWS